MLQRPAALGRENLPSRCGKNRSPSRPKTAIKRLRHCYQPLWLGYPLRFISGQNPEPVVTFPSYKSMQKWPWGLAGETISPTKTSVSYLCLQHLGVRLGPSFPSATLSLGLRPGTARCPSPVGAAPGQGQSQERRKGRARPGPRRRHRARVRGPCAAAGLRAAREAAGTRRGQRGAFAGRGALGRARGGGHTGAVGADRGRRSGAPVARSGYARPCAAVTCALRRAAVGFAAPGADGGRVERGGKKKKTKEKGLFANHFPYRCSSRLLQTTKQAGAAGSPWRAGQQMKGAAGTHRADVFTRRYSFILLQNDVYIQIKEIDLS